MAYIGGSPSGRVSEGEDAESLYNHLSDEEKGPPQKSQAGGCRFPLRKGTVLSLLVLPAI